MPASPNAASLTHDSAELAREYDRISADLQFQSGTSLAHQLAIAPGEHVFDLGCGTGLLTEYIADIVGPSGSVLGIDPLPQRITLAQARARANLEFRLGDAYALDTLADASFDVVYVNAVFHWLPEKTGPLAQFARILKPGGRLGISTGVKGGRACMDDISAEVLSQLPFSDYPRPAESIMWLVNEQELRMLLERAGFVVPLIETANTTHMFPTAEATIRYAEVSSFGNFLGHLPEALRPAARDAIKRKLETIATPEGIRRDGRRLVAIATR